jgi:hypothetical protein
LLNNKSIDLATGEIAEGYNNDGLMMFPTWQTNSIVYNQSMVTKLPSQMATAAIYGRNLTANEESNEDLTLEPAAKQIGKLFNNMHNKDAPKDKVLGGIERVLGNSKYSNFGYNALPDQEGLVSEISLNGSGIPGIEIDVDRIIQIYTEKQIMEILNDGTPHVDPETGEEDGFWSDLWDGLKEVANVTLMIATAGALSGERLAKMGKAISNWWGDDLDFRFMYTIDGVMKKHYKSALIFFLKQFPDSLQRKKDIITPIELEVTIDGTGGIYAGEAFSSTYIPKKYRDACVFQIMDVSHSVDTTGWKTTLRGLMRIDYGYGKKKPLVEELKDLISKKSTSSESEPPYLSFSEYCIATAGMKSPYKKEPKVAEPDKDEAYHTKKAEGG